MFHLLHFWYITGSLGIWKAAQGTLSTLEGQFAVRSTLRNMTKPLFQDYTLQGRVIGFGFRVLRILAALFIYTLVLLGYFGFFLIWLAFPFICVLSIIGSFFPPTSYEGLT